MRGERGMGVKERSIYMSVHCLACVDRVCR